MSNPETSRYYYIRGVREVRPNDALVKLMAQIGRLSTRKFEPMDTTWLSFSDTAADKLVPGYEAFSEGIEIPAVAPYNVQGLRVTQFERIALKSPRIAGVFRRLCNNMEAADRLYARMEACANQSGLRDDKLSIDVQGVIKSTRPEYAYLGDEYALVANPSTTVDLLVNQSRLIHEYILDTGAGQQIDREYHEPQVAIPFIRLPHDISQTEKDDFIGEVQSCVPRYGLAVTLGPLNWAKNTERASYTLD